MPSTDRQMDSAFAIAEYIPPDAIFEVTKHYFADSDPRKVNVGQGTYRDENGKPWVLPSVRMAKEAIVGCGHEYLPIAGLKSFRDNAVTIVFHGTSALSEGRVSKILINWPLIKTEACKLDCFLPITLRHWGSTTRRACFEESQFQLADMFHY